MIKTNAAKLLIRLNKIFFLNQGNLGRVGGAVSRHTDECVSYTAQRRTLSLLTNQKVLSLLFHYFVHYHFCNCESLEKSLLWVALARKVEVEDECRCSGLILPDLICHNWNLFFSSPYV